MFGCDTGLDSGHEKAGGDDLRKAQQVTAPTYQRDRNSKQLGKNIFPQLFSSSLLAAGWPFLGGLQLCLRCRIDMTHAFVKDALAQPAPGAVEIVFVVFPKIRGTILGVPIKRTMVFGGLILGSP